MVIEKSAMAGTLESSDAQVTVEPGDALEVSISSSVLNQYGRQIKATVLETLDRLDVKIGKVTIVDKGALECTLKRNPSLTPSPHSWSRSGRISTVTIN